MKARVAQPPSCQAHARLSPPSAPAGQPSAEEVQVRDTGLFKLYFGFALASLGMGLEYERLSIAYWERIAAQPPTATRES